jgi:hypothetical protein
MAMLTQTLFLATCLLGQTDVESVHAKNPVFSQVLDRGLEVEGQIIKLPPPRFLDGQSADSERAALRDVAGSERAADDLLRDSVTAPFIIRVHDVKAAGVTVRAADLWFAVHGDLKQVDPYQEANMWFQTRLLKTGELALPAIKPVVLGAGQSDWYLRVHAKLLDRIEFEVTNHIVASQSADSIVIASRTDPSFDKAGPLANGWKSLATSAGTPAEPAVQHPYSGGISYARIGRASSRPGALLMEMHVAFVEPEAWFQGAPILRSKFSVAAQDQIRTLRRELLKKRSK